MSSRKNARIIIGIATIVTAAMSTYLIRKKKTDSKIFYTKKSSERGLVV